MSIHLFIFWIPAIDLRQKKEKEKRGIKRATR